MLKNIRRYGSPQSAAGSMGAENRDYYVKICKGDTDARASSDDCPRHVFPWGRVRLWKEPGGHAQRQVCAGSHFPFLRTGSGFCEALIPSPALKANAVAVTQPGYGNSAPLHLDIDTGLRGKRRRGRQRSWH